MTNVTNSGLSLQDIERDLFSDIDAGAIYHINISQPIGFRPNTFKQLPFCMKYIGLIRVPKAFAFVSESLDKLPNRRVVSELVHRQTSYFDFDSNYVGLFRLACYLIGEYYYANKLKIIFSTNHDTPRKFQVKFRLCSVDQHYKVKFLAVNNQHTPVWRLTSKIQAYRVIAANSQYYLESIRPTEIEIPVRTGNNYITMQGNFPALADISVRFMVKYQGQKLKYDTNDVTILTENTIRVKAPALSDIPSKMHLTLKGKLQLMMRRVAIPNIQNLEFRFVINSL